MAGPTVTLTFEGNESDLVNSAKNVGDAFEGMTDQIGQSAKDIKSHSGAFDKLEEGADVSERRFTGFYDTLGGTTDALAAFSDESLSTHEKLIALGQAGADLAGGFADFLIPMMGNVVTFMRGPLVSAMSFVAAHPLIFAIGALVAAFVLLWTTSEDFRRIVIGVFQAVGSFIKDTFGTVIKWLTGAWETVINFFISIPDRIGRALSSLGSVISNAFKGALNLGIRVINWFVDRANDIIRGINWVSPFNDIPYIPRIAELQTGGRVQRDGLAFLHAGETVRSREETDRAGNGNTIAVEGDATTFLYQIINYGVKTGKIKLKAGGQPVRRG